MAGTHAGPLDLDLAAMEADLPRGLAPAVPVPSVSAAVAGTAHPGRILLQHAGKVARPVVRQKRSKLAPTSCQASSMIAAGTTVADVVDFFMALLSFRWIQHPEPTGSGRATPTSHFQQRPGTFPNYPVHLQCIHEAVLIDDDVAEEKVVPGGKTLIAVRPKLSSFRPFLMPRARFLLRMNFWK